MRKGDQCSLAVAGRWIRFIRSGKPSARLLNQGAGIRNWPLGLLRSNWLDNITSYFNRSLIRPYRGSSVEAPSEEENTKRRPNSMKARCIKLAHQGHRELYKVKVDQYQRPAEPVGPPAILSTFVETEWFDSRRFAQLENQRNGQPFEDVESRRSCGGLEGPD